MAEGILNNPGAVTTTAPTNINTTAQDVAKAQGVAYEDISKTAEATPTTDAYKNLNYDAAATNTSLISNAQSKPVTSYYDNAKSTVAGQLNTLLASNSPYIQQAEQGAKDQAAGRGLLNTTLAAGAGREAAIKSALPIATSDATEYNKFSLQKQALDNEQTKIQTEAIVSGEMSKQKAAITQTSQNIQNAFNSRLKGADEQSKTWLGDLSASHSIALKELEAEKTLLLQQFQTSANKAESIRNVSSQIMQNYQISVENLMTDPDFLNLGTAAVNNAINQMQNLAKNSIKFVGASSGVDMSSFVDTYLTSLSVR